MCVGTKTPLQCPICKYHYFSQGCATSVTLSSLFLLYTLGSTVDISQSKLEDNRAEYGGAIFASR